MSQKRYEPFKESLKSLCHNCKNKELDCFTASKVCGTDSKIGKSFIEKCGSFNKDMVAKVYEAAEVKTENSADSRIEMMGGGFKEKV